MWGDFKKFLQNPTPWRPVTLRYFRVVGIVTLFLVLAGYALLYLGYSHIIPAWIALTGQGVTAVIMVVLVWKALVRRKRDIEQDQSK